MEVNLYLGRYFRSLALLATFRYCPSLLEVSNTTSPLKFIPLTTDLHVRAHTSVPPPPSPSPPPLRTHLAACSMVTSSSSPTERMTGSASLYSRSAHTK